MRQLLLAFRKDESGATAIEYGLIASLIFVVIVASVVLVGGKTGALFDRINTVVGAALDGNDPGGGGEVGGD